jgi:hypothetical protein
MGPFIYFMCALTAFACCALLWRSWRSNHAALLLWSSLCFAGLTVSNVVLIFDKLVLLEVDLTTQRLTITLISLLLLIFGLVWGDDR